MSITPEHAADLDQLKRALAAIQKLRARVGAFEAARQEPVAIVGIGCRLPGGIDSPAAFWRLLRDGIEAVDVVPPERWDADAHYDPHPEALGKLPTRRGGFIGSVDGFDPQFFGIAPREAHAMDPQQRLILESAWEALEDAGIPPDRLVGSATGVFIGIGLNDYGRLQAPDQARDPSLVDAYTTAGNALCITANRLSYLLDLRGPSMAIDTACSSSLVAVHQAVQSLRRGESTLALVGGVNLLLAPETGIGVSRFLSPDGRCKFGDAGANGYVRGEGAIVIALKLQSRAVADGDPIYALIRGTAVNQDGFSSGLTVPNGVAQQALLREALREAGVAPGAIDYVEAHGTGTALGDPIEVQALSAVIAAGRDPERPLLVGSVKTNLGHLEAGAGIAGLTKTALALAAGAIPPSLHYERPNPNIDFERLAVRVQTSLAPWPEGERLAGVSSFGFGGTNAHAILQAAPVADKPPAPEAGAGHLLLLSAKSAPALRELAGRYATWLDNQPAPALADLCHTAAVGRSHHEHRLAFVAASADELRASLGMATTGSLPGGASSGQVAQGLQPKVAFLFTGQGAQYAGMGRGLYATEPAFRAALDRCAALLAPHLDRPLLDLLFAAPDSPEAALLDRTAYTQPALFALEYALAELWRSWGVTPAAVVGHSVGEYVAACVAGVFSLEEGLRLIAARGRLMGALPAGGAMAAIFAAPERVADAVRPHADCLSIAAVNDPGHVVIAGSATSVAAVADAFAAEGVRVRRLTVSHAFHSPLMEPILDEFAALARGVAFGVPQVPLIANLTGQPWPSATGPDADYWRRHLREPVQFAASLQSLHDLGCEVFVEIGPGPVLSGMGRATLPETATFVPSLRPNDERQILKSLGALYTRGVAVDWAALLGGQPRRLRLPTYPWQRQRYWFQRPATTPVPTLAAPNRIHPLIDRRLRSPALRGVVFEAEFGRANLPYLDDHRAYGAMIVPATAFLELATAAGRALDSRDYAVAELAIESPLVVPEEGARLVQAIVRPEGDGLQFEVISAGADDEWHQHAIGRLATVGTPEPVPGLDEARAACTAELPIDTTYARFATLGMGYGVGFRGLVGLWRGARSALGRVNLPASIGDQAGYRMHPALLDACLQVAGALLPADEDTVYLPTSLEGFVVRGLVGTRLWCHARALQARDGTALACALDIFDEAGDVVATIDRAIFRRAPRQALASLLGEAGNPVVPLQEVVWREAQPRTLPLPDETGRWLIFADPGRVGETLAAALTNRGDRADLVRPGATFARDGARDWRLDPDERDSFRRLLRETSTGLPLRGVVYLWGAAPRQDADEMPAGLRLALSGALHLAQALAEDEPARLWLVTRGAQPAAGEVTSPAQAALWGFARSLGREYPALRPICVDVDPGSGGDLAGDLLGELTTGGDESEVALRAGTRLVPRLAQRRAARSAERPVRLEIAETGAIDGLALRPLARRHPGPGQIEIRVRATGMNFRDVLNVLGLYPGDAGHPGSECAGVVCAVGEGVTEWRVGDAVVALADGSFGSYALAPALLAARLPARSSFAEAATLPIAFVTASYSLRYLAGIGRGTRVLIHSATGGVGLAALQIARAAGAEVFATAGSPEKRAFLRTLGVEHIYDSRVPGFAAAIRASTGGVGVDVVLNSLTGELIRESLDSLRDGGCFLEIGKRGIWTPEEVAALGRSLAYHEIYVGAICESAPELVSGILRGICAEVAEGALDALPRRSYPLDRAADAFRFMAQTRHLGKIVITQDAAESGAPLAAPRPDATYLITGGLGGLGLAVARWLVGSGARHLALVGRRAPGATAHAALAEMEQAARVLVLQADVARHNDVARVLATIDAELPPLAGVVHAAGALDDGVLPQQNWARFETILAPKLGGAWHLHTLTAARQLDFFVLFSAGAALVGAPGQTNYAAANAALDALAHWRQARGLPALSINWGPWTEVGMAAALGDEHRRRLVAQGLRSLTPEEGLWALGAAMASGSAQIAALPADWGTFARQFAPQAPPSLFRDLVDTAREVPDEHSASTDAGMAAHLAATPPSLRRNVLLRHVREQAAHVLGLATDEMVPAGRPLSELGLDSLMAVELRNMLGRALELALPSTTLFDYPTSDALTDFLLTQLPDAPGSDIAPAAAPVRPVIDAELDLATLSDEEAEALLLLELAR